MSDKDQFIFEDEDETPETGVGSEGKSQQPDAGDSEIFFDTENDLLGKSLGEQADTEGSDIGSESFFFDTEDDGSDVKQEKQPESGVEKESVESFSGDEDLFGDNLNAGFPDNEDIDDPVELAPEPHGKGGSSKNRTLLMVLLLILVAAGGAYYFMGLGSSTPSVPTVKMPVEKPAKVVSVPPPPPPVETAAPKKDEVVTAAVPPPPVAAVAKTEAKPAASAAKAEPVAKAKEEPVAKPATKPVAVTAPAPVKPAPVATGKASTPPAKTAEATVVKETASPAPAQSVKTVPAAKPAAAPKQVVDGSYALDAGSYLLDSNRKALIAKIEKLGYRPIVTPVEATLNMTRLRLGTYSKEDVQANLAAARKIEPGSYSAPAGEGYVIYAGTFLRTNNLEKLTKRFQDEGISIKSEPVQVVRTLSRIRFGSFASKKAAAEAASAVADAGVKVTVVKTK